MRSIDIDQLGMVAWDVDTSVANPLFGENVSPTGTFVLFHRTEATRTAAGDTQPSLRSLYGT